MKNLTSIFIAAAFALLFSCQNANKANDEPVDTATVPASDPKLASSVQINKISDYCLECRNCENVVCIAQTVAHHYLAPDEFESLKNKYYTDRGIDIADIPPALEQSTEYITNLINNVDCKRNCLEFNISEGDLSTHNNMTLQLRNSCPPPSPYYTYYTITLFRGLLTLNPGITEFHFVRIHDKVKQRGSLGFIAFAGNNPVYQGDLSSDFPVK